MSQCFYSSDSHAYEHDVLKWKLVTHTRGYYTTFQLEKLKKKTKPKNPEIYPFTSSNDWIIFGFEASRHAVILIS